MIVYHGSNIPVESPDVLHSRKNVDFSVGFYTTSIYDQAINWAQKFKHRNQDAVVSRYYFDEQAYKDVKCLIFDSYSEEWLDFILQCRSGKDNSEFDIVVGGVANDKVFDTVELFFDGLIDKGEAIKRLKYQKPNIQICFRNQEVIDKYLHFEGSEAI